MHCWFRKRVTHCQTTQLYCIVCKQCGLCVCVHILCGGLWLMLRLHGRKLYSWTNSLLDLVYCAKVTKIDSYQCCASILEPVTTGTGWQAVHTAYRSRVCHETNRHNHTYSQFGVSNWLNRQVFGLSHTGTERAWKLHPERSWRPARSWLLC